MFSQGWVSNNVGPYVYHAEYLQSWIICIRPQFTFMEISHKHWAVWFHWPSNCLFKSLSMLTTKKQTNMCITSPFCLKSTSIPDSKVHGANMGPTWVLSAPGGPHVGPMNLAIWDPFNSPNKGPVQQKMHVHVVTSSCSNISNLSGNNLTLNRLVQCSSVFYHGWNQIKQLCFVQFQTNSTWWMHRMCHLYKIY